MIYYLILEDNIQLLISSFTNTKYIGTEPLFFYVFIFLSKYFDSLLIYNIFLYLNLLLTYFFAFKFFEYFHNKKISLILATIFTFSPYFYYHSLSHIVLIQIWLLILYIFLLFKLLIVSEFKKFEPRYVYLGIYLGVLSALSNYIGFFAILFSLIFIPIFIFQRFRTIISSLKYYFINILSLPITFLITFLMLNFNFLINIFKVHGEDNLNSLLVIRPIEDFFIFTSRPWYYLIPSVDNPFFGFMSKNIINYLSNDWGNFLAQNYFKSEHSASYLGLLNLLLALIGLFYVTKKNININLSKDKFIILKSFVFTFVVLIFFTLPPYITLSGYKIYLPSYLVYQLLPMFRVLSRLGIINLLILLIFTGYGYMYLIHNIGTKINFNKFLSNLFIKLFLLLSLSIAIIEFYIPLKFTTLYEVPAIYSYISNELPGNKNIVVYPNSKNKEAYYWTKLHNMNLINQPGIFYNKNNTIINSADISENLLNCYDLIEYKNIFDLEYLINFSNLSSENVNKFFERNLVKIKEFNFITQENNVINDFYKITNTGNNSSNVSILYKIPNNLSTQECIN